MATRSPSPSGAEPPELESHPEIVGSEIAGDGAGRPASPPPAHPADVVQERLWWAAAVVWRRRWWVVAITVLTAAAAVAITLRIPDRYRAETRVLLPDEGSGLSSLLSGSSAAAALLGSTGGAGYTRYLALLTSRTTMEDVVEQYDLVRVYETGDAPDPVGRAVGQLAKRTGFDVSVEFNYLAVGVLDEDPQRAAQIANTFVEILNRENAAFNQESASSYRVYLERRVRRAEGDLDSLLYATQAFQERYGVIEPEIQGAALMTSLAEAQGLVSRAEVEYEMLRTEFGDENPQTRTAAAGVAAARRQVTDLTSGGDAVMPVPMGQLPLVGRRYAELQQGLLIQGETLKALQPLYEQALLSERRQSDAVQVLDPAVAPVRKAEPRRSVLVIGATLTALIVALFMVLALAIAQRVGPVVAARLRAA